MSNELTQRKVGRPLKFKSPTDMQKTIDEYFANCIANELPQTVSGLCLALGTYRETLLNYEHKDDFMDTIKTAKLRCMNYAETQMYSGKNPAGPIFALKNFGWSDKQEVSINDTRDQTITIKKDW